MLLTAGLWRLRCATRQRQAAAEATAQQVKDDLFRTQQAVMFGLAHLSESRDSLTGQHLQRMKLFTRELTSALSQTVKYQSLITPEYLRLIEVSAMLHDIGKVGVADRILQKPGTLTATERREMERHPLISSECLTQVEKRLGSSNFLQMAHEIALYHHERWDGKGYPYGLHGAAIPLSARIVAIADVYDALSSPRIYKPAFPHEQCIEMIRNGAGTQFDPDLVEVFLGIHERIAAISQSLSNVDAVSGSLTSRPAESQTNAINGAGRPTIDETLESVTQNLDRLDELLGSLGIEPNVSHAAAADLVSVI
jgi:putative two-component system response regulator